MNIKLVKMIQFSTNPLKTLTKDELNEFRKSIDNKFRNIEIQGEELDEYHLKWYKLHSECVQYAYWNNKTILLGYPENKERTYSNIIKVMINEELQRR